MSEDEILSKIDSFVDDFKNLDIVKRYQVVKEAVKNDAHLNSIEEQRKILQKGIKYMKDAKKDECIKACKELSIEYDNDPLVINYKSLKEEVFQLLSYLNDLVL